MINSNANAAPLLQVEWSKVEHLEQKTCSTTTPYRGGGWSGAELSLLLEWSNTLTVTTRHFSKVLERDAAALAGVTAWAKAVHEAGHATVGLATGRRIERASLDVVWSRGPYHAGEPPKGAEARAQLFKLIVTTVAGEIAQRRVSGSRASRLAASLDRETALGLAALLVPDHPHRVIHKARKLAERIVTREWAAICAVADSLEAAGELTGAEISEIFNRHRKAGRHG